MTTYLETDAGLVLPRSSNGNGRADSAQYEAMLSLYESRIADLESRLQEQSWMRLDGTDGKEFSRKAVGNVVEMARIAYLKNPLIRRAVEVGRLYVWGQDLSVNAADDNVREVVDRFWHDNRATLTGQQASGLLEIELEVAGNVFLALFPDQLTGAVAVRPVPVEEMQEIVCNQEDRTEVWFYRRQWSERSLNSESSQVKTALHPDWQYTPTDRPASLPSAAGDIPILWDAPVLHVKVGAFAHWRWGISEVYPALDWARAYKALLEDDATRSRALARFAWSLTTKGGRAGVAAAKTKLGTTIGTGLGTETNPPPVSGSTFIGGEGVDLQPLRIAGATLDPDHSRPVRLMAAAALGLPETFFGDADVGNHATAKTLDRPTELRYAERRQLWRDVLSGLIQWVIDRDIAATRGILRGQVSEDARAVELSWPDLLEPDIVARVGAVVDAATLKGSQAAGTLPDELTSRQLMSALGIEDIDEELAKLADEQVARDAKAEQIAKQTQQQPPPGTPTTQTTAPPVPTNEAAKPVTVTEEDLASSLDWWNRTFPELKDVIA